MRFVTRLRGFYRAVAVLLLMSFSQACMRWQPVGVRPAHLRSGGETVRALLDSGHMLTLHTAFVTRDTLMFSVGEGLPPDLAAKRAIPLARVRQVHAQRVEPGSTTLVLAGVALVAFAVWAVSEIDLSGMGSPMGYSARP